MAVPDSSRLLLRLEGAAVFAVAVGIYAVYGASWGWFAGLVLVPDAFMVGYLANPRAGAIVYNLGHTYVTPLVLGGVAFALKASFLGSVALIWTAHIGFDRLIGYGLKAPTDFHTTHLSASPTNADE